MAHQDVSELRRQPQPDEIFRAVHRAPDRRDGRPGKPFTQIYSSKLHEVQKFLSLSGHVYSPAFLTAGLKRFSAQPEPIRTAIETAARETQVFVYETAARAEKDLLDKIRASGIQVNEVNKDAFIAASRPTYEEFGKEVAGAKALIDKAVALGRP